MIAMHRWRMVLAFALISASVLIPPAAARDGEKAPPFTLKDLNGQTVSLSDLNGNIVVIHFAASW